MDRVKEASTFVKELHAYKKGEIEDYVFIKIVCSYFDKIKDLEYLSSSDLKFLKYISNIAGIPHYYDLLFSKFNHNEEFFEYGLNTFASLLYESTLHTNENIKIHKYQKKVLDKFEKNKLNRFFLSASTSFGKTFLVYEVIKKMNYNNVVLIFPTIALLSENLENIHRDKLFNDFKRSYKIHTLSEIDDFEERNIFIFTPERFLSFIEKNPDFKYDFVFVDEVYKLDNEFILNEESKENERDISYRVALYYILKNNIDVLLAGPYIELLKKDNDKYNPSFDNFLNANKFTTEDFNNIEIVIKSRTEIKGKKAYVVDDKLRINLTNPNHKDQKLIDILKSINNLKENAIIYCSSKSKTEFYAKVILESDIIFDEGLDEELVLLIEHLSSNINTNWIVIKALKQKIGIHHGLVPKYVQKEIIKLFNDGKLNILISTTTITEGINTSAKNLIVLQGTKGGKPLKKFDAKNIAGRAGRFSHHFTGRVLVLDNNFTKSIESEDEGISHKNYDKDIQKDEVDLFHSESEYISDEGKKLIVEIIKKQQERGIPDEIINLFKVVKKSDKIDLYDSIVNEFDKDTKRKYKYISLLKKSINAPKMNIDYDGFQFVLNIIKPIVKDKKLYRLINNVASIDKKNPNSKKYSILVYILSSYLNGGFSSLFKYNLENKKRKISENNYRNLTVDESVRDASEFIYNTMKYQLVKYLGVFDIMLRFYAFQKSRGERDFKKPILNKLITKLEYNALTKEGKLASDYGVPYKIVEYYDNKERQNKKEIVFDQYELEIFERVNSIISVDI